MSIAASASFIAAANKLLTTEKVCFSVLDLAGYFFGSRLYNWSNLLDSESIYFNLACNSDNLIFNSPNFDWSKSLIALRKLWSNDSFTEFNLESNDSDSLSFLFLKTY